MLLDLFFRKKEVKPNIRERSSEKQHISVQRFYRNWYTIYLLESELTSGFRNYSFEEKISQLDDLVRNNFLNFYQINFDEKKFTMKMNLVEGYGITPSETSDALTFSFTWEHSIGDGFMKCIIAAVIVNYKQNPFGLRLFNIETPSTARFWEYQ